MPFESVQKRYIYATDQKTQITRQVENTLELESIIWQTFEIGKPQKLDRALCMNMWDMWGLIREEWRGGLENKLKLVSNGSDALYMFANLCIVISIRSGPKCITSVV